MRGEEEKGILCTRNSELGRGNEVKGWGWGDEETDLVTHVGESSGAGGGAVEGEGEALKNPVKRERENPPSF